jgi:glycosyltransferase involved in cell wall biosynthesis
MPSLSAVIITFNEEKNIGRCITSVKEVADEVLVVDSFSTDRTGEICHSLGATFVQHSWAGYSGQKNFADSIAKHDYILSIDADEALSDELRKSILKIKDNLEYDGYEMNRLTNYCGTWIRHGSWYPDRKLRLFDRRKAGWSVEIHEMLVLDGRKGFLKGDLLHYSYYAVSDHIRQANLFTDLTAKEAYSRGKRAGILKILFSPCIKFIRDYIFLLGFLDGYHGFMVCRISAWATFLKYAKLRQLQKMKNTTP